MLYPQTSSPGVRRLLIRVGPYQRISVTWLPGRAGSSQMEQRLPSSGLHWMTCVPTRHLQTKKSSKKKFPYNCWPTQWRNHARAITGSARVGFISARAVARPENELGVLCLSITNQDVFRFKTAV